MNNEMTADEKVEAAKLAEQTERYDDMAKYMMEATKDKKSLISEERNLLSVAFKNVVGAKRSSWRVVTALEEKQEGNDEKKATIKDYREKIEKELKKVCDEVLVGVTPPLSVVFVHLTEGLSTACFYLKTIFLLY